MQSILKLPLNSYLFRYYEMEKCMENLELLSDLLKNFDITLSDQQILQFQNYYDLLIEWNSFMNLTAITNLDEVIIKHFVDSISLVKAFPELGFKDYSMIDVGTGAGFPGIPLKIVFPNLQITLLDSLNKRVKFLDHVISNLSLNHIHAVHGRAEDLAKVKEYREQYYLCVSRAVANLSTLSEYCLPFVKQGGYFVSYKSEKITDEYEQAHHAIHILGGSFYKQVDFCLPNTDIYRNLFVIEKMKSTPLKYPRKAGLPSKEPLT